MTTIKKAVHEDVKAITEYAEFGKLKKKLFTDSDFRTTDFNSFLLNHILDPSSVVLISVDGGGKVFGFLIMTIDLVPWNKKQRWASDVLFMADRDAKALLATGIEWAQKFNCWKIFFSNSTGQKQADKFFESCGLVRTGGQYEFCQESG